jgi:hypothetical protein
MIWRNSRSVGSTDLFSCYCSPSHPSVALSPQRLSQNRHLSPSDEGKYWTLGTKGDWEQ